MFVCRFTNVTRDFKGTLDYILYTSDSLAPAALLELPDEGEVRLCTLNPTPLVSLHSHHLLASASSTFVL